MKSQIKIASGGSNESGWMQNICTNCGWKGKAHYAYDDYQHTNCTRERNLHKCKTDSSKELKPASFSVD